MSSFDFWQKWLFVVGVIITVFGVFMALFKGTRLFFIFDSQINPVFWPSGAMSPEAGLFQRWAYGVWGSTIAGWGVFVAYIAAYPFKNKEKWAWTCLVVGLLLWFLLDTGISLSHKVYFNAIFNVAVLILAMLPVICTKKDFG